MSFMPFAATVGGWLGASGASAAAIGGTAIASTLAGAASLGLQMASAGKKMPDIGKKMPDIKMPEQPKEADANKQAQERTRRAQVAQGRNRTIFTNPLGIGGQANVVRRTLLGL